MRSFRPRLSFNNVTAVPDPEPKRFRSIVYSAGPKSLTPKGASEFEAHVVAPLAFGGAPTDPLIREVQPNLRPNDGESAGRPTASADVNGATACVNSDSPPSGFSHVIRRRCIPTGPIADREYLDIPDFLRRAR